MYVNAFFYALGTELDVNPMLASLTRGSLHAVV